MSRLDRKIEEQNRRLRDDGGARNSEIGEVLRWSPDQQSKLVEKHNLNQSNPDEYRRNMDKFKRSGDFKRVSTYKKRFF
jgi:hypothetical protein